MDGFEAQNFSELVENQLRDLRDRMASCVLGNKFSNILGDAFSMAYVFGFDELFETKIH